MMQWTKLTNKNKHKLITLPIVHKQELGLSRTDGAMKLSIMTFSITTIRKMTLGKMTSSTTTLSITIKNATLSNFNNLRT
jgi:hypothetical protein